MYIVEITWKDEEPTIMECDTLKKAHDWASHYLFKMRDPEVQGMIGVSVKAM